MGSLPADANQDREIQALNLDIERLREEVDKNYDWIDRFKPPADVQDAVEAVKELEIKFAVLQERLRVLTEKVE